MKWIVSDFFERSPVLMGPVLALLIFVVVFSAAALHALYAHKPRNERLAALPLEREDVRRG